MRRITESIVMVDRIMAYLKLCIEQTCEHTVVKRGELCLRDVVVTSAFQGGNVHADHRHASVARGVKTPPRRASKRRVRYRDQGDSNDVH